MSDHIQVFIVDDHPVVREGLKMLLGSAPDLRVVGEAASACEAAQRLPAARPDVVMLDLALAGDDGIDGLPTLERAAPGARFLVLTGLRDAGRHQEVLLAGAHGLVLKDEPSEVVLRAIRKVHAGELWFNRPLLGSAVQQAVAERRRSDPRRARVDSLTDREREIIALVAEGLRNDDIGGRLSISEKTVRNHITGICAKLGVAGRLELLVYANQHAMGRIPPSAPQT
jgi:DNA-binding NarL/FixJ family response regulator